MEEEVSDLVGDGEFEPAGREVIVDSGVQDTPAPITRMTTSDTNNCFTLAAHFLFTLISSYQLLVRSWDLGIGVMGKESLHEHKDNG